MQPLTFSGGVNLKLEAILLFLGTVENFYEGELSEKDKGRTIFLLLRERAYLWWARVKADRKEANNGHVETWSKFMKLFLEYFLSYDHIKNIKERLKDLR